MAQACRIFEQFMYDFSDRVVIVTGGTSGIGKSTVTTLSGFGASVVVADVNADLGDALAGDIQARGGQAMFVRTDVSKEADVKNLVDATTDRFGKPDGAFRIWGAADWRVTNFARAPLPTFRSVADGTIIHLVNGYLKECKFELFQRVSDPAIA